MLLNGFFITIGIILAIVAVLIVIFVILVLYAAFDINRDYKRRRKEIENGKTKIDTIDDQSAADEQEVRHGQWLKANHDPLDGNYFCSICHDSVDIATGDETPIDRGLNYCPNCGAKMVKDGE